ncbi:MAG: enoyl-CoA hydratase/isomerase family protein [Proteobacteria bacterium]|nr:enoyl-CoA hydratase/isomerase family protein [Pseudomonadota bacterium]
MANTLKFKTDARGVATLTLERAEKHNAFDDVMIAELLQVLEDVESDETIRLLVLRAAGKSFSAGADLDWMRRMADYDQEQNLADAMQLARLMYSLNRLNRPVIALVQGASFGGGVGLIACCDIAIASSDAIFSLSEVRLGLIPSVISPYVIAAIGARAARRYFLTGERFDAGRAMQIGLIHEVVDPDALDASLENCIDDLLLAGPKAQIAARDLIHRVDGRPIDETLIAETARRIAELRASDEGREGLNAFLEKRQPNWSKGED